MNIIMVGTGYVGLTTGVCLANIGHHVVCIDIDTEKIKKLRDGIVPIFEPGLEELMQKSMNEQRISFDSDMTEHVPTAQAIFIAVQTPQDKDGRADLTYVKKVAQTIGEIFHKQKTTHRPLIVNKSTVPVGTATLVREIISSLFSGEFDVASNPEFLREGSAVQDFLRPDRVVVGTQNKKARDLMEEMYAPVDGKKLFTTIESSEMIKYASNAFLATKISFINEIANVCENCGADVKSVAEGMGLDKRIGEKFLSAGLGYGGSCFPKDVRALHSIALNNGYDFLLLKAVVEVNNNQRNMLIRKIKNKLGPKMHGKKIAVLGLAFKNNTDDVRESAAVEIIQRLRGEGARIKAFDPVATENAKKVLMDSCDYAPTAYEAVQGVDAIVITTEWPEFIQLDFSQIKQAVRQPLVFDGKNILDKEKLIKLGFEYYGMGR